MYDIDNEKATCALNEITQEVMLLESRGLLPGTLTSSEQIELVSVHGSIQECLAGAVYVQVGYCNSHFQMATNIHHENRVKLYVLILDWYNGNRLQIDRSKNPVYLPF